MASETDHDLLVEIRSDVRYIRKTLADHEDRLRILEQQRSQLVSLHQLEDRVDSLEQQEIKEKAVESWKHLTLSRLIALIGASGGIGGVIGWAASYFHFLGWC